MGYTHGERWTDNKIKEGILEVIKNYELDRMPSRAEVKAYFNNDKLANAISKRDGGWYRLAGEMGLRIKESDTYFGKRHERIVAERLASMGYEVRQMPQNFPYDLLVNEALKIDVKVSRLYKGENGNFYTFHTSKPFVTCDLYILLTLQDNNEIKDYYILPSLYVATQSQISMGENRSKYDIFKFNWSYLERYDDFAQNMKAGV